MKRLRDYGITIGRLPTGALNKITDVQGVLVGHKTVNQDDNHTGITVIIPGPGNCFSEKFIASGYIHNGFGKTCGLPQIQELGTLETPIALTNTLNVGLVADGLVEYTIRQCKQDNVAVTSINPVVGECNDSRINNIQKRVLGFQDLTQAINNTGADFAEGAVGAGTGTVCYGLKGGIGSASRLIDIEGKVYTIGVLVQSNFGATEDFVLEGRKIGKEILASKAKMARLAVAEQDQGSIMTVIATDVPVTSRQLYRIIRRAGVGIARTGGYSGHGSGEIMLGFSTANRQSKDSKAVNSLNYLREDLLNSIFLAVAESTQEAILNSLVTTEDCWGIKGEHYYALRDFL